MNAPHVIVSEKDLFDAILFDLSATGMPRDFIVESVDMCFYLYVLKKCEESMESAFAAIKTGSAPNLLPPNHRSVYLDVKSRYLQVEKRRQNTSTRKFQKKVQKQPSGIEPGSPGQSQVLSFDDTWISSVIKSLKRHYNYQTLVMRRTFRNSGNPQLRKAIRVYYAILAGKVKLQDFNILRSPLEEIYNLMPGPYILFQLGKHFLSKKKPSEPSVRIGADPQPSRICTASRQICARQGDLYHGDADSALAGQGCESARSTQSGDTSTELSSSLTPGANIQRPRRARATKVGVLSAKTVKLQNREGRAHGELQHERNQSPQISMEFFEYLKGNDKRMDQRKRTRHNQNMQRKRTESCVQRANLPLTLGFLPESIDDTSPEITDVPTPNVFDSETSVAGGGIDQQPVCGLPESASPLSHETDDMELEYTPVDAGGDTTRNRVLSAVSAATDARRIHYASDYMAIEQTDRSCFAQSFDLFTCGDAILTADVKDAHIACVDSFISMIPTGTATSYSAYGNATDNREPLHEASETFPVAVHAANLVFHMVAVVSARASHALAAATNSSALFESPTSQFRVDKDFVIQFGPSSYQELRTVSHCDNYIEAPSSSSFRIYQSVGNMQTFASPVSATEASQQQGMLSVALP